MNRDRKTNRDIFVSRCHVFTSFRGNTFRNNQERKVNYSSPSARQPTTVRHRRPNRYCVYMHEVVFDF